jgi:hypothetical protein
MKKRYIISAINIATKDLLDWQAPAWRNVDIAEINDFHPKSSDHHPKTYVKIGHDDQNIYVIFKVEDKYVRSTYIEYNSKVNEDSCVEWFIKPPDAEGYYNFEMNAGGTLHVNYIIDPERDENGKRKNIIAIPESHAKTVKIISSLPRVIDPEISDPTVWYLAMTIPLSFFELYSPVDKIDGSVWQGNLYKCGDKTSHPHWGYWSPVKELNFHQPHCFGEFIF